MNIGLRSSYPFVPSRRSVSATFPTAHLDPDRCAVETELLPQLVHQEPLVRKMKRRRDVGEEDERRRRVADLRGVQDAHMLPPGADWRMRGRNGFDELVEHRSGNP